MNIPAILFDDFIFFGSVIELSTDYGISLIYYIPIFAQEIILLCHILTIGNEFKLFKLIDVSAWGLPWSKFKNRNLPPPPHPSSLA